MKDHRGCWSKQTAPPPLWTKKIKSARPFEGIAGFQSVEYGPNMDTIYSETFSGERYLMYLPNCPGQEIYITLELTYGGRSCAYSMARIC